MLGTGGACTADEMGIRELQFGWLVQEPGGKGEVVRGSQGRKKTANLSVSQILGQESQRIAQVSLLTQMKRYLFRAASGRGLYYFQNLSFL